MKISDVKEIGREMEIARKSVPFRNRAKFDVETKDCYQAICEAVREGNLYRAASLYEGWTLRKIWLSSDPDCHLAPPCLVRKEGETEKAYLDRCYEAGRWI